MSRKFKSILAVILICLIGATVFYVSKKMDTPVKVKALKLKRGDLKVVVTATTTSTIESEHDVTVSSRMMGTIYRMLVKEGDFVRAGQLIAELDKSDILAQIARADADIASAQQRLAQSQAGVSMARGQAEFAVEESKAVLRESEKSLERVKTLFDKGMVSRADVDAAQRGYEVAKARYDTTVSGIDINKIKAQEVAVARAAVKQAQATLLTLKVQLGYASITAPISGVISKRPVDIGEMVNITLGSPVVTIVDPDDIYIRSTIDEVDVPKVKVGMSVNVKVDALPDEILPGTVYRVSPIVVGEKQETRTFEVRTHLAKPNNMLKPGMSADIEILSREMKNVVAIPAQSILERDGKKVVYKVSEGRAKLLPVQIGYLSWSDAEIIGGVGEGDVVLTTPDAAGLKDGCKVVVEEEK